MGTCLLAVCEMLSRQVFAAIAAVPASRAGLIVAIALYPLAVVAFRLVMEDFAVLRPVEGRVGVEGRDKAHSAAPICCVWPGFLRSQDKTARVLEQSALRTGRIRAGCDDQPRALRRAPSCIGGSGGHPARIRRGSATSCLPTWRSCGSDGADPQFPSTSCSTRREHEISDAMHQTRLREPTQRVLRTRRVLCLACDLAKAPRVGRRQQYVQDALVLALLAHGFNTLIGHRKVLPFGDTPPAVTSGAGALLGSADPTPSQQSQREFRYSFRSPQRCAA